MNTRDYIMASSRGLSDRLIEDRRGGSLNRADAWDADAHRIDDLAFDPGKHSHADCRTSDRSPHAGPESLWLCYRSYEPRMPPPGGYERLAPPPPAFAPEPGPEPVRYQDSLMTPTLFDWNMHHLLDAPRIPGLGWIGSSRDVIPDRLADITIELSRLHSPPPDEPW